MIPGGALGFGENQLIILFRTFVAGFLDNYQKYLVWLCYCSALPLRDKRSRHGTVISPTYPKCVRDKETVLYDFVECLEISRQLTFVEKLLSVIGSVQLSAEPIIKIVSPPSLNRERKTNTHHLPRRKDIS